MTVSASGGSYPLPKLRDYAGSPTQNPPIGEDSNIMPGLSSVDCGLTTAVFPKPLSILRILPNSQRLILRILPGANPGQSPILPRADPAQGPVRPMREAGSSKEGGVSSDE